MAESSFTLFDLLILLTDQQEASLKLNTYKEIKNHLEGGQHTPSQLLLATNFVPEVGGWGGGGVVVLS